MTMELVSVIVEVRGEDHDERSSVSCVPHIEKFGLADNSDEIEGDIEERGDR